MCRKDKYKPDQKNKEKLLPCEHDEVERKIRNAALVRKDNRNILDTQKQRSEGKIIPLSQIMPFKLRKPKSVGKASKGTGK